MNTQTQEALKMAIEAMERAEEIDWELNSLHVLNILQAIQACKEALAQPAQEPVAFCKHGVPKGVCTLGEKDCNPAPSWQGLSDDEIQSILDNSVYCEVDAEPFARAIEAKLKEKNT